MRQKECGKKNPGKWNGPESRLAEERFHDSPPLVVFRLIAQ